MFADVELRIAAMRLFMWLEPLVGYTPLRRTPREDEGLRQSGGFQIISWKPCETLWNYNKLNEIIWSPEKSYEIQRESYEVIWNP